jgi:hypothetical protein
MFYCDVCNAPLDFRQGFTVSSADFNKLLDADFGIDEYNIKMLTDTGMKRDEAIESLMATYKASTSDWLLCEKCGKKAQDLMPNTILCKRG